MSQKNYNGSRLTRNRAKHKKMRIFKRIIYSGIIFIVAIIIAGTCLFTYYASSAPKITRSALSSDNSTKIYDNQGKVISRLGAQNRDYVSSKDMPKQLKSAMVSVEDRRFYKHHLGIDPLRIIGASFANLTGSSLGLQGGSTLTQQLVKLSVFSTSASDRTIKRKAQEAWDAYKVERTYSKQKILEFYANKVYMGNNVYGMQTAAEYYYNKPLNKLSLPETAMIAGIPQSPTLYNPYIYPTQAKERRNQVLSAMVSNHQITQQDAHNAAQVNIKTGLAKSHKKTDLTSVNQKYIDSYLKETIQELRSKHFKTNAGLKIYTNLDLNNQKHLYQLANNNQTIHFPDNQFQVGATLLNSKTGQVNAMLGGRKSKVLYGLNRAVQTDRSNGSTMKPLMDYGPALEYYSFPTYQRVFDTPFTYPGTNIQLNDYDNRHEGAITMRKALVESRNIPAIRTLQNVGIDRATSFLNGLGMNFNQPLSLQNGIGGYVSTEQEAAAYAAFANGGIYHKPYMINKIVESNGQTHNYSSEGHRAMSESTAFMMNDMLKGVMNSSDGSGTAAKIPGLYEAGKTGTTQYPANYVNKVPADASMDSWFSGYTSNYSLSIWSGYDHQYDPGHYITYSNSLIAQQLYKYGMSYAQQGQPNVDWSKPNNVNAIKKNGTTEYFLSGHEGEDGTNNSNNDKDNKKKDNDNKDSSSSSSDSSSNSSNSSHNNESSQSSDSSSHNNNESSSSQSDNSSSDSNKNTSSSSESSSSSSSLPFPDKPSNKSESSNNQSDSKQDSSSINH